jgi:penicillin-binding protein 1A
MRQALANVPVQSFAPPGDITFVSINPRTGRLARQGTPGSVTECFLSGTEPKGYDEEKEAGDNPANVFPTQLQKKP